MSVRNYLYTTGSELIKEADKVEKYFIEFDILSINWIIPLENNKYRQIAKVIDLPSENPIEIYEDADYFFYNKSLIEDPTVRILFDNRISNDYSFELPEDEVIYLRQIGRVISGYQNNEDYDLGDKYISNLLSQMIMYYKLVLDQQTGKTPVKKNSRYIQQRAQEFVHAVATYYKVNKKLEFYADHIMVSKRTLSMITKKAFGKSPKCILDSHIVEMAKTHLKQSDMPLKDIASDLGFSETNNFLSFFKKITKLTPTEYREKYFSTIRMILFFFIEI